VCGSSRPQLRLKRCEPSIPTIVLKHYEPPVNPSIVRLVTALVALPAATATTPCHSCTLVAVYVWRAVGAAASAWPAHGCHCFVSTWLGSPCRCIMPCGSPPTAHHLSRHLCKLRKTLNTTLTQQQNEHRAIGMKCTTSICICTQEFRYHPNSPL
jgi:hypothetical protein